MMHACIVAHRYSDSDTLSVYEIIQVYTATVLETKVLEEEASSVLSRNSFPRVSPQRNYKRQLQVQQSY